METKIAHFLLQYQMTPHTTTGMYLTSRTILVVSSEQDWMQSDLLLECQVKSKQLKQKENHDRKSCEQI